jgi:hypothetical protein
MLFHHALGRADFLANDFLLYKHLFVTRALALGTGLTLAIMSVKQTAQGWQFLHAVRHLLHFIHGLFDLFDFGHKFATVLDTFASWRHLLREVHRWSVIGERDAAREQHQRAEQS